MADFVSVVVPLFNQAAFVERAVCSVLAQTHRDFEIIVVDDGSTDDGPAIVESLLDSRIRLLRSERGGPSRALNTGIRAAHGPFIAIMGADDISEPERLSSQTRDILESELGAVFCLPTNIDEQDRPLLHLDASSLFKRVDQETPARHLRMLFYEGNYICAPTMCARKEMFDRVGPFHQGLIQLQDWEYWIRMAGNDVAFATRREHLVRYRRHATNLSARSRKIAADRESLFVWRDFFHGLQPRLVREAFSDILDPAADFDVPLVDDQIAMIYLSHPRLSVREFFAGRLISARQIGVDPKHVSNLRFDEYFDLLNRA